MVFFLQIFKKEQMNAIHNEWILCRDIFPVGLCDSWLCVSDEVDVLVGLQLCQIYANVRIIVGTVSV